MPRRGIPLLRALRARDQNGQLGPLSNSPGTRSCIDDVDGSGVSAQWFAAVNADRDIPMELDEDADGDGLTTREEYFLGTNPNNWDTSGDGLPDGWKFRTGLDPLSADDADEDSDGDGLANRQEYELGTDPRNPDSSGDGIPDGWKFRMGLDPLTSANEDGADADPDADDATNWEEYVADTDPLDDASRLQIDSIQSADGAVFLHLDASPARRFAVTSTTNLLAPWHVLAPAQPGQGPGTEFEIPAPSPAGYLIIRAEVP